MSLLQAAAPPKFSELADKKSFFHHIQLSELRNRGLRPTLAVVKTFRQCYGRSSCCCSSKA